MANPSNLPDMPETTVLLNALFEIEISEDVARHLFSVYGEADVQLRYNAMNWTMQRTRINNPAGWLVRSLKEKWAIPAMPQGWSPNVIRLRMTGNDFLEISDTISERNGDKYAEGKDAMGPFKTRIRESHAKYFIGESITPEIKGKWIVFRSRTIPTNGSHGHLYGYVVGPFKTRRGARWAEDHPYSWDTIQEAERKAKPNRRKEHNV